MSGEVEDHAGPGFDFYGPQYARFGTPLAIEMRRAVYGEDIGQQGWRTAAEQSEIADLRLRYLISTSTKANSNSLAF